MNDRQRIRVLVLSGLIGLGVVGFVFAQTFWLPFKELDRQLEIAQNDAAEKQKELSTFLKEKKKLDIYRLQSLPPDFNIAKNEYHAYLKKLFTDSGLADESIPGGSGTETKVQPKDAGKKPGHTLLTYQVRARGDWAGLVKFLEKFQRAALLHRIKNLSIERPTDEDEDEIDRNPKLTVAMTIETMIVHQADKRPNNLPGVDNRAVALDTFAGLAGGPTGWPMILRGQALLAPEMPPRNYADLVKKNPFVGELPAPPPVVATEKKKEVAPPLPPPDREILQYIRLAGVADQKASLFNRYAVKWIELSPRNDTFEVYDDNRRLVVAGEVVRIDARDVYFQAGSSVYGIHLDQNLADALKTPLSNVQIEKLGLPVLTGPIEKSDKKGKDGPEPREVGNQQTPVP